METFFYFNQTMFRIYNNSIYLSVSHVFYSLDHLDKAQINKMNELGVWNL